MRHCLFILVHHKMHLQVSIALLLILLTGGFSLDCYECKNPLTAHHCSKTRCTECRSTKTVEYFGPYREHADNMKRERDRVPNRIKNRHAICPGKGFTEETNSYGCSMPHECKSWSVGTGCWTAEYGAECCDTNRCNQNPPVLPSHILNGKRCFTCDEEDCTKTISCWGNEDHCFTAYEPSSHQSVATKGCASKSVCDQEPRKILGLNGNITCCEGNLCNGAQDDPQSSRYSGAQNVPQTSMCNGAQSVTQSFLFLCGFLLFYFLLH